MEQSPRNAIATTKQPPIHDEHKPIQNRPRKRTNIFKVALFMMRGRSGKSKALPVDDGSKSVWKKLVGSMRPLNLQSNQSPPMITHLAQPTPPSETENGTVDHGEDALSDFRAEEQCPGSPSPPNSRYASAVGLNELVPQDEENQTEEECKEHDDGGNGDGDGDGDEMIDAKAEEFIAHFYQEMRLQHIQRMDSMDFRFRERRMRSLG